MDQARIPALVVAGLAALLWLVGCPQPGGPLDDDDQVEDDDTGDDDTADDDDVTDDDDATDDDDVTDDDDDTGDDDDDDDTVNPAILEGLVYLLDLVNGGFVFTEPAGVGGLLQQFLPDDQGIIFTATDIDDGAGTVELLIGTATEVSPSVWEQQYAPTVDASGIWYNPDFAVGPTELMVDLGGTMAWLGDAEFEGVYSPGGGAVYELYMAAELDTAALDEALGFNLGFVCGLLAAISAQCQTCPASSPHAGDYCIHVVAEQGTCPLLPGISMQSIP